MLLPLPLLSAVPQPPPGPDVVDVPKPTLDPLWRAREAGRRKQGWTWRAHGGCTCGCRRRVAQRGVNVLCRPITVLQSSGFALKASRASGDYI